MKPRYLIPMISVTMIAAGSAQAVEFKLSGQVSRMVVAPDDASGSEIQNQDIGWSGTRFRFTGQQDLDNGTKVGFRLEQQLQSNPSFTSEGANQVNGGNDDFIDNRYQDLYWQGGFGKIAMGKGDGASNGGTEADLSGTALSSSSNHQDNWGNYLLIDNEDGGVTWDSIFTMNDGLSRVNRVRYDTPSFAGISVAASAGQGGSIELGAKYKADLGSAKIDARAFFADAKDFAADAEIMGMSGSILLTNGLNATMAFSDRDNQLTADQDATTIKLGYKFGIHAVTVDYGVGETGDVEADTAGITYAAVPISGVEIFTTYRELDSDLQGAESISLVALGSRIRF